MGKQTLCPDCQSRGKFVFMLYSPQSRYYICPVCKGVFTPAPPDDESVVRMVEDEITKLMREKYKSNLPAKEPIPAGRAALGKGGSKVKGKNQKGLMQKKSLAKLNEGLNGKDIRFESR